MFRRLKRFLTKFYDRPSLFSSPGQITLSGVLWVPEEEVENYWSVIGCHLESPTLWSSEQQCYQGATWASIKDNHIKRRPCHSTHLEVKYFSLSCLESRWGWSGGRTEGPVVVRMIQGRLIATGYHSRHPDRRIKLITTAATDACWNKNKNEGPSRDNHPTGAIISEYLVNMYVWTINVLYRFLLPKWDQWINCVLTIRI